jgi:hypothetical protein
MISWANLSKDEFLSAKFFDRVSYLVLITLYSTSCSDNFFLSFLISFDLICFTCLLDEASAICGSYSS